MTKRSKVRAAGYVFIVIASLGCGGDSFDNVRNLRSTNEAIVCLGDSLTEGVGANGGEDYPAVLSRELAFPVRNHGRRGDTTALALARLSEVLAGNPRLVIVLLGGNDFLRQVPRAETKKNLAEMVRRIQAQGAMVAIAGMRLGIFTDEYGPIYEETAKQFGAYYIPQVMQGILTDAKLKSDPIHPNGAGYRLMGQRIAEKIRPLLREADRLTGRRGF
ncbi:MAG: GDSL-type esterase/lipase family protein [Candidatus Binatia bacterium]